MERFSRRIPHRKGSSPVNRSSSRPSIASEAAFDGDEAETTRPELLMKPAARPSKSVRRLSFCHEAGPSGYGLQEALSSMPLRCWLGLPGATLALNRPTEPRWG